MKPLSSYLQRCCRPAHFILCPHQRSNIINLDLVDAPILDFGFGDLVKKTHEKKREQDKKEEKEITVPAPKDSTTKKIILRGG